MTSETVNQQVQLAETFREAEQAGLRIAIKCRLAALLLLGTYLVVSRMANPEHSLELGLGIAIFAALGRVLRPRTAPSLRSLGAKFYAGADNESMRAELQLRVLAGTAGRKGCTSG